MRQTNLIKPYGGSLVNLIVEPNEVERLKTHATKLNSIQLSQRALNDLELLAVGAFSPLQSFMGKDDYDRVVHEMRLQSGHIFPIPITLSVDTEASVKLDEDIALRTAKNELLGVLTVEEIYGIRKNSQITFFKREI